ncbi:MAG: CRTAC1 family protein [Candidatus Firestonebacteria bacterium]|nr:CRTAC1 family protein [Candidatus Firestonebacteria bacterium]
MRNKITLQICLFIFSFFLAQNVYAINFSDVTELSGLGDRGRGKGVAIADVNGDGLLDVFISNKGGGSHLYVNKGDFKFDDFTEEAGLTDIGYCTGSVFGDVNNDGYIDLYIPKGGVYEVEPNRLLINDGKGHFKDVSKESGVGGLDYSYCSLLADFDNDGYLDLFVANYGVGSQNRLYHNKGVNTQGIPIFKEITNECGIGGYKRWSWSGTATDIDNDGKLDLYVVCGRYPNGEKNLMFKNVSTKGNIKFLDISEQSGTDDPQWGLGAAFADVDNDGDMDLALSNYVGERTVEMFLNDGTGHFAKVSKDIGLKHEGWGKGPTFGDIDHDGYLDIYEGDCKWDNQLYHNDTAAKGKLWFSEITDQFPFMKCETVRSKGTAFADLDNDGDLDIYVVNWETPNKIFRNEQNDNNWIKVELKGTISNKSAIGGLVKVYDSQHLGDMKFFKGMRDVKTSSGFCSMPGLESHFGLDSKKTYDIEARFPSGIVVTRLNVETGQKIIIEEPMVIGKK